MYYSFSVIFNIVAGITAHPLSQLFNEHMTKMLKEFKDAHRGTVMDKVLYNLVQNFCLVSLVTCLSLNISWLTWTCNFVRNTGLLPTSVSASVFFMSDWFFFAWSLCKNTLIDHLRTMESSFS